MSIVSEEKEYRQVTKGNMVKWLEEGVAWERFPFPLFSDTEIYVLLEVEAEDTAQSGGD